MKGLPAVLVLLLLGGLLIGIVVLVLFVGLAFAAAGLLVSAIAGLGYAFKRHFAGSSQTQAPDNGQMDATVPGVVREIKIDEVLRIEKNRC